MAMMPELKEQNVPPSTRNRRELALLNAQKSVLERIIRDDALPEVLAALCRIVETQASSGARASILLTDEKMERLFTGAAPSLPDTYNAAIDGIHIAVDLGTCCAAAARGEVVFTPDIARDPGWQGLSHLPLALGLQAAWSMPIFSSSGKVLGTYGTYFEERRLPTAHEYELVGMLASTAALAIERKHTDQAIRLNSERNGFLAALAVATQALSDVAQIMSVSARMLAEHLDVERCAYAEVEDERVFLITGDHARGVRSIVGRWDVAAFGPACARAMRDGLAFVVNDIEQHPGIDADHLAAYRATDIRAVICVPLHKNGRFTAAMAVHQSRPRQWTAYEVELAELVASRCWEALERARVSRTLQLSEERYRTMVETSPQCVKIVASDGRLLQINNAGLRVMELSGQDMIGTCVYEYIVPEHRQRYRQFNESICRGERGSLEYDVITQSGERRHLETIATPLATPNGDYHQLALTRDITDALRAASALAMSRARLDYAVQLSGIGFWYCDLPFDELNWDDRVKEHFFLQPQDRASIETFYARLHPDDRERTRAAIDAAVAQVHRYDVTYRTTDPSSDRIKWIRAMGGTACDDKGQPFRFDGVTMDVTREKLAEERLARLLETEQRQAMQLRDEDRRKDEFIATLAHELRNPLAPVRTGLQLLQISNDPRHRARAIEMMERQVGHLVRMVDDLLDVSRITHGKLTLQLERIDFRSILHSAMETSRPIIESRGHEVSQKLPQEALPLLGDPTRLSQLISNLLNNAARYTPNPGHIRVVAAVEMQQIVVRISDSGIGIPVNMTDKVFEMFTQVREISGQAESGLGIGLTLVRKLAELHGGSIRADSEGPGLGSTFTLKLPLASAQGSITQQLSPDGERSAAGRRILVVDDNIDAAESLGMLLSLSGHQVTLAHRGPEALAMALDLRPEVILLDIGLPGMSGHEVASALRREIAYQPFLIALTGWGSEEDRRRAQETGFDDHLVKPVELDTLTAALNRIDVRRS